MMYRPAEAADVKQLLTYMEQDLKNCLYSYIDLKKFGIENPHLQVYFDETKSSEHPKKAGIRCTALKYYEGLQLFDASGSIDARATAALIYTLDSHIVSSTVDVIEKLYPLLKKDYEMECGYVTEMRQLESSGDISEVVQADRSDYGEISRLICSDAGVGGHYRPEELEEQLLTRLDENFGRNYILKRDDEIVCHAATYAELPNLAVISGVITRADCRGKGIGTLAVKKLCQDLLKEGKRPCLFYYTEQAAAFYKKIGFEAGTGWAKLVKRKEPPCTM